MIYVRLLLRDLGVSPGVAKRGDWLIGVAMSKMMGAIGSSVKAVVKGQNKTEEEERAGENPSFMDEPALEWLLSRALYTCLWLSLLYYTLLLVCGISLTIYLPPLSPPPPHTHTLVG